VIILTKKRTIGSEDGIARIFLEVKILHCRFHTEQFVVQSHEEALDSKEISVYLSNYQHGQFTMGSEVVELIRKV